MKENIFKRTGSAIVHGIIHFIYFIWSVADLIIFLPKIEYEDEESKRLMNSDTPCILIGNHTSHNDGFFVPQALFKKKMYVLVTNKWYGKKSLNIFFRHLRYIPIDLNTLDTGWLESCKEVMDKGCSVLIFPEGKIEREGYVHEFLPGFLMLAKRTDAPIIPLAITGGYRKFRRQHILVGKKIEYDVKQKGRPSQIFKEGADICKTQIEDMLKRAQ